MESQILFLGSATGGTASQQLRGTGGIIIQVQGYQFFLDAGPGALLRARQFSVDARSTTAVMVSHAHLNHCNDTNAVIGTMSHNGLDVRGVLIASESVVKGTEEIRAPLSVFHQKCVERVITPKPGQKIGIESVEIHALKTIHADPTAIGFKFLTQDFVLAYSADTGYSEEIADQYRGADILILNVPYVAKDNNENLNVDDAIKIIERTGPKLAIITHFGLKMHKEDPILVARRIHHETGVQTLAAKDGMTISPTSYSAGLRQKTLNLYPSTKSQQASQEDSQESQTASPDKSDLPFL